MLITLLESFDRAKHEIDKNQAEEANEAKSPLFSKYEPRN